MAPALAGVAVILADLLPGGPIKAARDWGFDTWQRNDVAGDPSAKVVIVGIDEAALAKGGRWPWSREKLARLLPPLAQARAIGIDILLRDPDSAAPSADQALAAALRQCRAVLAVGEAPAALPAADPIAPVPVTPIRQSGDEPTPYLTRIGAPLPPLPIFAAASGLGVSVIGGGPVVRALPGIVQSAGTLWPGFTVAVLRAATGSSDIGLRTDGTGVTGIDIGRHRLPTDPSGALLPRFATAGAVRHVSAASLLDGTADPALFRDRIVLLGVDAPGAGPLLATPLGLAHPLAIEAAAVETALQGRLLWRPPFALWGERLLALLLAGLAPLWIDRPRHRALGGILAVGLLALPAGAAAAYFGPGLLLDWVLPAAALAASAIASVARLAARSAEEAQARARAEAAESRERVLRETADAARQSLSLALDAAELGVWDADIARGTWRCSPQYAPILGLSDVPPHWSAAHMLAAMDPADRGQAEAALSGAADDRFSFECRVGPAGAPRAARVVGQVWRDPAGRVARVAGAVADITRERALERQLRQGERMQAIGLLAGGVAHNFNNLLTIVVGKLDLAEAQLPPDNQTAGLIQGAMAAAERGTHVARHLLAFARGQKIESREIDFGAHLREVATLSGYTLPRNLSVTVDVPADLDPVEVNPTEFDLALLNLVLNARDAMPNGGHIRIAARNEATCRPQIGLDGSYVVVSVSDDGPGMPPDILARAFEPFVTTKPPTAGTGLGLTQVHSFAKGAGGAAEIECPPGGGTTVRLYLPRFVPDPALQVATRPAAAAAQIAARPVAAQPRGRILLVEDEREIAAVAADILAAEGYQVATAHSAPEALDRLRAGQEFDVLFSDIVMPGGMSGRALAAVARREFPQLRILLTTGYSPEAASADISAFPVLAKPYRAADLCRSVATVLRADLTQPVPS